MTRRTLFLASLALIAFGAGFLASRLAVPETPATATILSKPRPLPAFELTDQHGAPFSNANLADRWSLLFFGFTNCPDVCPMALSTLKTVASNLSDVPLAQRPQIVFISVDPTRDTPEIIGRYVSHFGADFVGATAPLGAMTPLLDTLGVARAYPRTGDDGSYTVDHSAGIYVISPAAEEFAVFTSPHVPAEIESDYRLLLEAGSRM